jgi:hypothetical protein
VTKMEPEIVVRDELGHLRRELVGEAKSPSEKALLLVALELAELRNTLESLLCHASHK